jgi:hypothetical protein
VEDDDVLGLQERQQGGEDWIYVTTCIFLLPSRHNYPYESKVLKSIMFTLRRHVSANTGPSSGQQRTYKKQ